MVVLMMVKKSGPRGHADAGLYLWCSLAMRSCRTLWASSQAPLGGRIPAPQNSKDPEALTPLSITPSPPPYPHDLCVRVLSVRVVALVQHQQVHHAKTHERNAQHVEQDLGGHHQHLCNTHCPG